MMKQKASLNEKKTDKPNKIPHYCLKGLREGVSVPERDETLFKL